MNTKTLKVIAFYIICMAIGVGIGLAITNANAQTPAPTAPLFDLQNFRATCRATISRQVVVNADGTVKETVYTCNNII